jgi:hypothetical protein
MPLQREKKTKVRSPTVVFHCDLESVTGVDTGNDRSLLAHPLPPPPFFS